jgi:hypothetical protein
MTCAPGITIRSFYVRSTSMEFQIERDGGQALWRGAIF